MASCPRCDVPLLERRTPVGVVYACPQCGGQNAALSVLRTARAHPAFLKYLWAASRRSDATRRLRCPHCRRPMAAVAALVHGRRLDLDVCPFCRAVWLDRAEFEAVPRTAPPAPEPERPQRLREAEAVLKMRAREAEAAGPVDLGTRPDAWWHWLPGVLGMPVEQEAPGLRDRPWLTWSIAAFLVLVFIATLPNHEQIIKQWGFVPSQWDRHGGLTIAASFFLHAGIFHLVSNLYFFLVFGDNVEDHLGPVFFLLLLAGAHAAGGLVHAAYDPRADLPCVGASAGISGVLGYYAVAFPRARLSFLWFWLVWVRISALTALVLYSLLQVFGSMMQASGAGGVSYLAHLGGLTVGVAVAVAVRLTRGPEEAASAEV